MLFRMGPQTATDSRGNPYRSLTHGGVNLEGTGHATNTDRDAAWTAYWDVLTRFIAAERARVIEWRVPPTMEENNGQYWVRSRLSVVERNDG